MRAATYTRTGPAADVPELEEVPVPAPGAGEARGQTVLIQGRGTDVRADGTGPRGDVPARRHCRRP